MLSPRSFTTLLTLTLALALSLPTTSALFSFNSTIASNGITITHQSFNGTIPPGTLSASCATAYATPLNCSTSLLFVGPHSVNFSSTAPATLTAIPKTAFEMLYRDVCTPSCYASLQSWRDGLVGACGGDFDALFSAMYTDGYQDPEAYLQSDGLPVKGAGKDMYQFGSAYRYSESQWLDWIFWGKCLRDLNTTSYCSLSELTDELTIWPSTEGSRHLHLTKDEAIARNQTFCEQATCFMQSEMIDVIATGMFQGENATSADIISRIGDVCPSINVTASFPFLRIGVMYPFDNASTKIMPDSAPTGHGTDGIVDLSGVNSTRANGSSAMPAPVLGKALHVLCFVFVVGAALLL